MSYSLKNGGMRLKKVLASILVVILCGCSFNDGYGVTVKQEEQESDYSTVYAEIIEFRGIKNKEYQSQLNLSIEDNVWDAIHQFDSIAQEAQKTLPQGVKSSLYITQKLKRNTNDFISFIMEHYMFTGGAHGTIMWYPRTVDVTAQTPHDLTLDELFEVNDYIDKINAIIKQEVGENPDIYSELWEEPVVTKENENRFYLTQDELVIFFPPYELSYYAKGFIEFPIELKELSPYLTDKLKVHSD